MLAFSCHIDDEPELQEQEDRLEIVSASSEAKDLFNEWMGNSNPNARTIPQFSTRDMVQINRSGMTRYAAPKIGDPNTSISFVVDEKGVVDMAFFSNTVINKDWSITSKIYSMDNQLMMEIVQNLDGTLRGNPEIYTTNGWWKEFNYCLGKVLDPFDTPAISLAMDAVFSYVTLGAYVPAVAVSCAGFGLARM